MAFEYPFPITNLTTPAFCVDRSRVVGNCEKMINRAKDFGAELRPHMKTHKTVEGGILMTGGTKRRIVVSTLAEAEFFADAGFDDILYGYPLTAEKIPRCLNLANRLDQFHVFTDNEITIDALSKCHNPKGWSVFLKVDCGNGRAGIHWENVEMGASLVKKLTSHENLRFSGLYIHCGDSYKAGADGTMKSTECGARAIGRLRQFAKGIQDKTGIEPPRIGTGSTPSCSLPPAQMKEVSEMHPGNYIFYDAQQYTIGSCTLDDIACTVATRVIGHYPYRNQLLIDCGFAALTKQGMGLLPGGCVIFRDHADIKLIDMTQEIGKVTRVDGQPINWEKYPIGTMLFMYPYHVSGTVDGLILSGLSVGACQVVWARVDTVSWAMKPDHSHLRFQACATAALHPVYYITEGNEVVDTWRPCRGW